MGAWPIYVPGIPAAENVVPRPWVREDGPRTLKGHGLRMVFGGFCLIKGFKRPLGASGFIFESRGAEARRSSLKCARAIAEKASPSTGWGQRATRDDKKLVPSQPLIVRLIAFKQ